MNDISAISSANILLIDDTPANLHLLIQLLADMGYMIRPVTEGRLAIAAAQAEPPDLILLDILMPEMDGYEVCKQLKLDERTKDIPIIFISAVNEVFDKVKAFSLGGVDYITKPFQLHEVIARIESQLAIQKLSQQLKAQNEQLQQEIAIRKQSQEQLELFFSQSLDGFFFMMLDEPINWDDTVERSKALDYIFAHQRITKVNDAILKQYSAKREEFIGLTPNDFFAHDIAYGKEVWRQLFDAGRLHIETDERRSDGTQMWVEGDYICLYDTEGRITGHFGIQRDISDRKLSETKIRQAQLFLDSIIENIPDMIFVKEAKELKFVRFNKAGEELLGYSREELIGKNDYDFFPKEEADFFVTKDREVLASGLVVDILEEPIQTKEKGLRILHTKKLAIVDETRTPQYLLGISEDITDHKQSLEALRESEERFRRAFEDAAIGMALVGMDGRSLQVNRSLCAMLGYTESEFLATTFQEITYSEDLEPNLYDYHWVLASEINTYHIEKRYIHKLGHTVWVLLSVSIMHDSEGRPLYFISQIQDINERKLAEAKQRQSEANLAEAQRIAHVGNWQFDVKSHTINWSAEVFRIFGLDPTQPIPTYTQYLQLIHPDDRPMLQKYIESAIANGISYQVDHRIIQPDGSIRYIEGRGKAVFNAQGQVIKLFGTVLDITERKQAEAKMRQALEQEKELNLLKSRFISMASHEFRTPLSTIQSAADLLEYYDWSVEEKQERFEQIRNAVQHMTLLLQDVLFLGKADVGKLNVRRTWLDLNKFCTQLAAEMQLIAAAQHILNFVSQCSCKQVYLDEQLLRQILTNLLTNAIKYSPPGSKIQFELLCESQTAIFLVQDEGIGIPVTDQHRVFESFHRAANVDNVPGTGLGLTIVKRCVNCLGGEIIFTSEVGLGTTFRVKLPLNQGLE